MRHRLHFFVLIFGALFLIYAARRYQNCSTGSSYLFKWRPDNGLALNRSKVAFLMEDRANPMLIPLVLHFMTVLDDDWPFQLMGNEDMFTMLNASRIMRKHLLSEKLAFRYLSPGMVTSNEDSLSAVLTEKSFWEPFDAEWILFYQSDTVICARSNQRVEDYFEYAWTGAPWKGGGVGNGGFSLRRKSWLLRALDHPSRANSLSGTDDGEAKWFVEQLRALDAPFIDYEGAKKWAMERVESVEPLGLHKDHRGNKFFDTIVQHWCPEAKFLFPAEYEKCPECDAD